MSSAFDRNTALALIIVQGFEDEDIKNYIDFCVAAADRFNGIVARKAEFSGYNIPYVEDWLERAKHVVEITEGVE